jgi:DNA-binding transcriptional MocR family regulator
MWDVHPDRDEEWFKKETRNMSRRQIAQELECNFNTSGETVIDPENMEWIMANIREPKHKTGFDRNFWIWEEYDPSCNYLMSADVARGDGADSSTFHILKLETMEIVGEYMGKPTPDLYANMLNQVGREFGNCMLVVES